MTAFPVTPSPCATADLGGEKRRGYRFLTCHVKAALRLIALLGCLAVPAPHCCRRSPISRPLHNPFPQLSRVAVAPFFNQSNEPTVDGRRIALAYFNELQLVPGFEVVPVEMAEKGDSSTIGWAMQSPADARLLAQILKC